MKETKVYVDELPKSCGCCEFYSQDKYCAYCLMLNEKLRYIDKDKDCPLKSLHEHDKELVEKVLEEVENTFTEYLPLKNRTGAWFYGRLNEILKKYQKEFEDGK